VAPLGQTLAGPDFKGECIPTADLDLDEIPRGKYDFDAAGHYARLDVFRLHVNERPARSVAIEAGPANDGPHQAHDEPNADS
jgi:nitrilase